MSVGHNIRVAQRKCCVGSRERCDCGGMQDLERQWIEHGPAQGVARWQVLLASPFTCHMPAQRNARATFAPWAKGRIVSRIGFSAGRCGGSGGPALPAPASHQTRPMNRSRPSRIVSGCGGQPGIKRSTGTTEAAPSRISGCPAYGPPAMAQDPQAITILGDGTAA